MNLLIVGFSVTEMPSSYVPHLSRLLEKQDRSIALERCGIGGISVEHLSYLIETILRSRPLTTHVMFEISTGNGRWELAPQLKSQPAMFAVLASRIEHLIEACHRRGLPCGFISFPRTDVDPLNDPIDEAIARRCAQQGVPFRNVSRDLKKNGTALDGLLLDVVHPSPAGAESYAWQALALIEEIGLTRVPSSLREQQQCYSFVPFDAILQRDRQTFSRHGFVTDYVTMDGGESVALRLPQPCHIAGVAALAGPLGSLLTVQSAEFHQHIFYDEYCYYQRLMVAPMNVGWTDQISIHLSPDVPDIPLLKGEKNMGSRQLGLVGLLCDQVPT